MFQKTFYPLGVAFSSHELLATANTPVQKVLARLLHGDRLPALLVEFKIKRFPVNHSVYIDLRLRCDFPGVARGECQEDEVAELLLRSILNEVDEASVILFLNYWACNNELWMSAPINEGGAQ